MSQPTVQAPGLLKQWRRQWTAHRRRREEPRPFAALRFLAPSGVDAGLVDARRVQVLVLRDEPRQGSLAVIAACYRGTPAPHGFAWGGAERCILRKNLCLRPNGCGEGPRFHCRGHGLLEQTLALDRLLDRHARHPHAPHASELRLPALWLAFAPSVAAQLRGGGPELLERAEQQGVDPQELFRQAARPRRGAVLFPLDWTSDAWDRSLAVFAELASIPSRQVIQLVDPEDQLAGYRGAAAFDFLRHPFGCPARAAA